MLLYTCSSVSYPLRTYVRREAGRYCVSQNTCLKLLPFILHAMGKWRGGLFFVPIFMCEPPHPMFSPVSDDSSSVITDSKTVVCFSLMKILYLQAGTSSIFAKEFFYGFFCQFIQSPSYIRLFINDQPKEQYPIPQKNNPIPGRC